MTEGSARWRSLWAVALVAFMSVKDLYATSPSIKILTLDWTSQIVVSHIAGELLQKLGYSIAYLSESADSQWFMLSSGQADLQIEVWEGSMAEQMSNLTRRGLIIDAGAHKALTREDWWYPNYVKGQCPGLPDWRALRDCARLFSVNGSIRGTYYSGPWEKPDRARIRALDLPFDVVTLKDAEALRKVLENAIEKKRPIMIFNWTPNWVESVYEGEFVEFPQYEESCETDPEWGINPEMTWDCGNPKSGWLKKAVSRRLTANWPCAYALIRRISLANADIAESAVLVDKEGLTHDAAAKHWLQAHKSQWTEWIHALECKAETSW